MKLPPVVRTSIALLAFSALSSCGGSSGANISATNPGFFSSRVSDETMRGVFNPQGFSTAQVRKLVAETCTSALGSFNAQPREDDLAAFSATCASWRSGAGVVEFERAGGSNVVIEITGSNAGNLLYDRIDTSL